MKLAHFAEFYKASSHFDRFLGLELEVHEPGKISYRLAVTEQHLSAPGACHGGVIAGMMDSVLGVTALSWAVLREQFCATVEFKIHYFSPVKLADTLEGTGEIDFTGSKLLVTTARINDLSSGQTVAKGIGTFTLYPISKKAHLADLLSHTSTL